MADERVFIIGGHVVNSRKANSKSSLVNDTHFQQSSEKEALNVGCKVSHFYFSGIFKKTSVGLEMNNCFPSAMKRGLGGISGRVGCGLEAVVEKPFSK